MSVLLTALLAALASALLCAVVVQVGPLDRPRARGAHDRPVATGGGVAIMAGASLGLLAFALTGSRPLADARQVAAALAYAGALGLLGALDDQYDLGARAKLLAQAAASLAFALFAARIEALPIASGLSLPLSAVGGVLGTTLWLVVATNAVNFMDGANGLASGCTAIASLALAAAAFGAGASAVGAAALAGAAASLGFLPWNLWRKRLFQGDAGALFSGGLLAALAVVAAGRSGAERVQVFFAPLALAPFLIDVLLTLLARARGRRPLLQAHREHLFQLWLAHTGRPHAALAWRAYAIVGACSLAAWASARWTPLPRLLLFAAAIAAGSAAWIWLRRRYAAEAAVERR